MSQDDLSNPPSQRTPLGGRAGVTIASVTPLISLVLFFLFGFMGHWGWSWLFWLLVPIVRVVVYGPSGRQQS